MNSTAKASAPVAKSSGASAAQMPAKSLKSFAPVAKSSGALRARRANVMSNEGTLQTQKNPRSRKLGGLCLIVYTKGCATAGSRASRRIPPAHPCQYPRHRCLKMSVGQEPPHTTFLTQRTAPVNGLPFGPLALRQFTVAELA